MLEFKYFGKEQDSNWEWHAGDVESGVKFLDVLGAKKVSAFL